MFITHAVPVLNNLLVRWEPWPCVDQPQDGTRIEIDYSTGDELARQDKAPSQATLFRCRCYVAVIPVLASFCDQLDLVLALTLPLVRGPIRY